MSDFVATLLGAAIGVVAGTAIQYGVQLLLTRRVRRKMLDDLKIEAQLNLNTAEQMLDEVAKYRAAAQPATFANYRWFFRAKDMIGVALTRVINSGELYRIFTRQEIIDIQSLQQFFTIQMEQFISDEIDKYKAANDIPGAHAWANHVENEIRRRLDIWRNLIARQ